jgi:Pyruvate/2-oxoacid:ferredoxin oxidoreductase delta subunit
MQAQRNGVPMLASSGYISQVDEELCIGCSDCAAYCQFGALAVIEGVNHVNYDNCMGCGVCTSKCEQGALSLVLDERKGVPLQVCDLADLSV